MYKNVSIIYILAFMLPVSAIAANKAGVVVQNSTGEVITRCVEFEEPEITVEELLQRTGFQLTISQSEYGAALCYLHDDGMADPDACFSDERGWFWNFFTHNGETWESASLGISNINAVDGSIFGFAYGAWGEAFPPARSFADVCEITSRAGIVIDHSNGTRRIVVVEFPGETTTCYELLLGSGLELVSSVSMWGVGICAIDGEGQTADNCFGELGDPYWGFSTLDENQEWFSALTGVDTTLAGAGDVCGFFYATWGTPQPLVTLQEVFGGGSAVEYWESLR